MNDTPVNPALGAPGDSTPSARAIRGVIENISPTAISGWCTDLHSVQEALVLEFSAGGRVLGFTTCGLPRPDVAQAGFGIGMSGFSWHPPKPLQQAELDALDACVFETSHLLPRMDRELARVAPAAAAPKAPGFITLDQANAAGFSGWIRCGDARLALTIALHADGACIAKDSADQFRADVAESGLDAGTHGFNLAVPAALFDGLPHELTLHVPELDLTLAIAAGTVFRHYDAGGFHVRNGILRGWIDPARLPAGTRELTVSDGARVVGRIPLDAPTDGAAFGFQFELPFRLSDGQPHLIAINLRDTRYRLAAQGGSLDVTWREDVMGRVETIDKHAVVGWVYDGTVPADSLDVELYDGDQLLCRMPTTLPRSDVNKLFGITGVHGFQIPFPAALYDGHARHLSVRANGVALNLKPAHDVPLVLTAADLAAIPAAQRYQGFVEHVNTGLVMGWAWDRKRPDVPVHVAIYLDGELLDTVQANRFNARLRAENRSGHHVYLMRIPARMMNGAKRALRVVIVEGGLEIEHEHTSLRFPLVDHFGAKAALDARLNYRHTVPANLWRGKPVPPLPAAAGDAPELSLIVLNWNGAGILRDFLESLLRIDWRHRYELLLVDHGSTDGSLELAQWYVDRLPLRILARGVNFSFSASNNYAAGLARGQYLVFANNDLVMLHDCLAPMRAHLDDTAVGAVGLKLLEPLADGAGKWRYITHHQGVQFKVDTLGGKGHQYYAPMEIGEQPEAGLAACYDLPIATGALLMCRASDFGAVGGFQEGYVYGMEDVDLCLTLRRQLGKAILCDTAAVALHNRSATRDSKILAGARQKMYSAKLHAANRKLYVERHGRGLARTILRSLVAGETMWRPTPLRVTIAVTSTDPNTPAGDYFTALELGEAMRRLYGWEVMFASMQTHHLPGTDVLVAMRYDYAIEKIAEGNPGLVTVAWIRNRVNQWVESERFQSYQLIFGSSQKTLDEVRAATGRNATLLPIAANARRFHPQPPAPEHRSDVTFTGSYWGVEREAIGLQDLQSERYRFAIYGHGWDKRPDWRANWRGAVPYAALPQIYNSAHIVLDDSHPVTREWHSLNSRVFDALASGKLVLTNCRGGAQELFGDRLPTFQTDAELQALVRHYLDNPEERETLAASLYEEVVAKHTYDQRAATFRDGLLDLLDRRLRFAIKIGVPDMAQREQWGDYHFALGIQRALEARGHVARIDILPEWYAGTTAGDDVVIVLRGLSQYQPQPTTINLAWLISHPDEVGISELQQYHHVFVASDSFAQWLQARLGDQVSTLLQCTDPALFYPEQDPDLDVPDTIFVGNSRGVAREAVQYALAAGVDFAVYGGLWEGILPAEQVRATYIPNDRLRHYYSAAKAVLNDHWSDMRAQGFVSNRLFDAGACSAAIVTDDMDACRVLFGDAVHYYGSPAQLAAAVNGLRATKPSKNKGKNKLRDVILAKHTFQHRVDDILSVVARFVSLDQTVEAKQ